MKQILVRILRWTRTSFASNAYAGNLNQAFFGRSVGPEEHLRLRAFLVPVMQDLHGFGSQQFWNICLFYFILDTLKAEGFCPSKPKTPYDDVAYKELTRWGRPERVNRGILENLAEILQEGNMTHQSARSRAVFSQLPSKAKKILFMMRFLLRYLFRKKRRGAEKRKLLYRAATSIPDKTLARAIRYMPVHLVEDFEFFHCLKMDYPNPLDTRKMKNGLAVTFASFGERGGQTRLMQHGAFYGETQYDNVETELPTFFHTWGWSYASHHVPGPSDVLDSFARSFSKLPQSEKDLLVVLPAYLDVDHRKKLELIWPELEAVAERAGMDLRLRPRPRKVPQANTAQQQEIQNLLGNHRVSFSSQTNFETALSKSKLTISLAHPATAFLETLRVNQPILALASDRHAYLPEYEVFFSNLVDLGVLHLTEHSLIKLLDMVVEDPKAWWSEISLDERMVQFKEHFCGRGRADRLGDFSSEKPRGVPREKLL